MNLEDKTEKGKVTDLSESLVKAIRNSNYRPVELYEEIEKLRKWRILSSRSDKRFDYAV